MGSKSQSEKSIETYNRIDSLRKTLQILLDKDIIDKSGDRYYIQDHLFEYWLKLKIY